MELVLKRGHFAQIPDEEIQLRSSVGQLCAGGCDISGTHTLSYGTGAAEKTATAHCSW